jgi:hypothetical protein
MTYRSRPETALETFAQDVPPNLPDGSVVRRIDFASERVESRTLLEFPSPEPCFAVMVGRDAPASLELLTVPAESHDEPELLATVRTWIDATIEPAEPSVMITLHGAQVFWGRRRAAIVAPAERLEAAIVAAVEFAFHDGQTRGIEQAIATRWPELEADAPLAFDFHARFLRRRDVLAERFREWVALRARYARLLPLVNRPPVYPPTLASQISERLRERTRLADRLDFCDEQLEVFEQVYERCGDRASEFLLARKGHTLEWIIIVLLAFQTLLLVLERLSTLGT